eukprot:101459_1
MSVNWKKIGLVMVWLFCLEITSRLKSWFLIFLSFRLIFGCNTARILDSICPIVALLSMKYFTHQNNDNIQNQLFYLIYYLLHYIAFLFISSATLDIKTKSFHQPADAIIPSTEKTKLGIKYYMENKTPTDDIFDKLLLKEDKLCDNMYVELLKLLPLTKYKNVTPVQIILTEAENDKNSIFADFVDNISKVPDWVNFDTIAAGQNFYISKFIIITYILGLGTLVGGFSCPSINKILISSRYWASDNDKKSLLNTLNRLNETAIWIYCVMNNSDTLKPFGKGWKSIIRVRLFHARIRYKLNKQNDEIFSKDTYEYGVINQLHLIATLLGFAYNPLSVCNKLLLIPVNEKEREGYLHLWKYIGHVLGIDFDMNIDPLKDYDTSRAWIVKIFDYIIHPDCDKEEKSTTKMLSTHVLSAISFGTELFRSISTWRRVVGYIIPFKINVKEYVQSLFAVMAPSEYVKLLKYKPAQFKFELQIRISIGMIRVYHILLQVLCLKWFNLWFGKRLYTRYARLINDVLMEKKGNYKCRFAKYM